MLGSMYHDLTMASISEDIRLIMSQALPFLGHLQSEEAIAPIRIVGIQGQWASSPTEEIQWRLLKFHRRSALSWALHPYRNTLVAEET